MKKRLRIVEGDGIIGVDVDLPLHRLFEEILEVVVLLFLEIHVHRVPVPSAGHLAGGERSESPQIQVSHLRRQYSHW